MPEPTDDEFAILAAVPLRHLRSGLDVCAGLGVVALPATGRGDLDGADAGDPVYLYAYQVGERPVPAATWRAVLVSVVDAVAGDHPDPERTPPTWREDRDAPVPTEPPPAGETDDGDEIDDEEPAGSGPPEVFLEVAELRELDRRDWLFTNELVRKRDRGARTFVPVTPVRVRLPE